MCVVYVYGFVFVYGSVCMCMLICCVYLYRGVCIGM